MIIFEPKSFLKNAASFWKKPAFEVNCCEAVISLPLASFTALPFLSTTFAVIKLRRWLHLQLRLTKHCHES